MKRGIGLTDIFLYLLVLFLMIIALAISGLGGITRTTITIEEDSAQEMLRASLVERSITESLPLIRVEGTVHEAPTYYGERETIDYGSYEITRAESLSMIATYVLHNVVGGLDDARLFPSVFYRTSELHRSPMRMRLSPTTHDRLDTVVPPRSEALDLLLVRPDESTFSVGIEERRVYAPERLIWVPGYVGSDVHPRGIFIGFEMPLEVALDER